MISILCLELVLTYFTSFTDYLKLIISSSEDENDVQEKIAYFKKTQHFQDMIFMHDISVLAHITRDEMGYPYEIGFTKNTIIAYNIEDYGTYSNVNIFNTYIHSLINLCIIYKKEHDYYSQCLSYIDDEEYAYEKEHINKFIHYFQILKSKYDVDPKQTNQRFKDLYIQYASEFQKPNYVFSDSLITSMMSESFKYRNSFIGLNDDLCHVKDDYHLKKQTRNLKKKERRSYRLTSRSIDRRLKCKVKY